MEKIETLSAAYRARDAIRRIALEVVRSEYPRARYATVTAVDRTLRTVTVEYPEEPGTTHAVKCGATMPVAAGAVVRVNGPTGARYVEDVVTGDANTSVGNWTPASLISGWTSMAGEARCGFRREGDLVRVVGTITKTTATTAGDPIINIPIGLQPPHTTRISAYVVDSTGSNTRSMFAVPSEFAITTPISMSGTQILYLNDSWALSAPV